MVSFKTLHDQTKVLHHWLMYKTRGSEADGAISAGIGSHVGSGVELIAGWAVGGNEIKLPEGIAAAIPPPGGKLMIEWHYYNPDPAMVEDQSGVEICVVPTSKIEPSKVASIVWVGNENLGAASLAGVIGVGGMPPGKESKVQDTCTPRFTGLPAGQPVRIFEFVPHMHQLGRHMRTWVARKDGTVQKVFDEAFEFAHQISYTQKPMIELFPGDKLVNGCTFFNDTKAAVGFGPSSDQEMCYQFTYAYPAGCAPERCLQPHRCDEHLLGQQAGRSRHVDRESRPTDARCRPAAVDQLGARARGPVEDQQRTQGDYGELRPERSVPRRGSPTSIGRSDPRAWRLERAIVLSKAIALAEPSVPTSSSAALVASDLHAATGSSEVRRKSCVRYPR